MFGYPTLSFPDETGVDGLPDLAWAEREVPEPQSFHSAAVGQCHELLDDCILQMVPAGVPDWVKAGESNW
jgi:hypothetical protein